MERSGTSALGVRRPVLYAAALGVRHWSGTHLLGDDVEISDPLDA